MKVIATTLNAKYIHTCLALRCLKAYAEPDLPVEIVEYTIKDPAMNVVSDLYSKDPDVIGFSCYIWNIEETIEIVKMLKKVKPEVKIVLGGPEVSYDVKDWLERIPEADYIVVGEGEETFKQLLEELNSEEKLHMVFGLGYRKNGDAVVNPPRPKLDLNQIPSPYRFQEDRAALNKRVTYFETSRGCPFSCQFCLSSIEVGVRYFDIERVKDDLLYLINSGAKLIKFVDRTFNIKRDYALEIFQFLIDNHGGAVFQFEITADIMRPEVLDFLNEHAPPGIFRFEIGVQSTNDETNDLVMRRQNFEKLKRTVALVKEGGKIDQHLDLIAGLPEEDYHSFRKTFNDVFALRPEELQLGFLKMLRGTGLRLRAEDHGYVYMDHSPYEILGNNVLPFSDIIRIKRVEDVLEKYWNDHRMDHTIEFLVEHEFDSAFDFFQAFGDYWDEKGWSRIGHQLEDLFRRLHQFLTDRNETKHLETIIGLLTYDYFHNHKHKPRTSWTTFALTKEEQSNYLKVLASHPEFVSSEFQALGLSEKDLHKHTMIDVLPFDIHHYLVTDEIKPAETLLIAYYHPKELQLYPFSCKLSSLLTHIKNER
ncbi:B12-binding domain-containing radical SAM protein [Desertibacillus haloalkaliphilus]|uniref:B12-binding domain-containing radical SAM protein n=1 Tax=Desertibacillus haloalkaliphilus TaxID=1328930 RepID=UPI001C25333C|nr:B12-binding domain-containing radical SAM protein [Desertibacillus haloalkaliphilus]MBU8904977.1 B12-binding domain-containing radical SAM protein [Desertibacillus haloalkaliphilus]